MISLTGRNDVKFILNSDHIEKIDEIDGSLITLTNGRKYIVVESVEEIIEKVIEYKNKILNYSNTDDIN